MATIYSTANFVNFLATICEILRHYYVRQDQGVNILYVVCDGVIIVVDMCCYSCAVS